MSELENIVNTNHDIRSYARQRIAAEKRARKLGKMLMYIGTLAFAAVCAAAGGYTGLVHPMLATDAAIASLMAGCFMLGRFVEVARRK